MPLAPVRFSTITVCPSTSPSLMPTRRATRSSAGAGRKRHHHGDRPCRPGLRDGRAQSATNGEQACDGNSKGASRKHRFPQFPSQNPARHCGMNGVGVPAQELPGFRFCAVRNTIAPCHLPPTPRHARQLFQRPVTTGPSPRSSPCSTCRSRTCCTARRGSIGGISKAQRRADLARCSRSRPAAARRTAPTVRRARSYETGVTRRKADGARRGARRSAARSRRRQPLLHGRGLALAEGPRSRRRSAPWSRASRRSGSRPAPRSACSPTARRGELKDAGPRLLQSQPRHLAGVLRRDHHHADLPGSPRHARPRARGRHPRLLRRHRRHGRDAARTASACCTTLANLPAHPESVPINLLVRVAGTPLGDEPALDPLEFVRTIAVARILMPRSMVRLSAGREDDERGDAGAVFLRRRQFDLLRGEASDDANPARNRDQALMDRLGLSAMDPT